MDYVISLGGSLIAPDKLDIEFLKNFRALILNHINLGKKFIVICGGGKIARDYQKSASEIVELTRDDLDWLGIHSTRLNAHLLRTIFRKEAHTVIIKNPNKKIETKKPLIIAAGWKPGFSTDYDAVVLARSYGIRTIINLSNIDYVYDSDPNKNSHAKPFKNLSWKDFRKLVGDKWDPGLNSPFDPIASKEAERLGLRVAIMSGRHLKNLDNFLIGKGFIGTTIK